MIKFSFPLFMIAIMLVAAACGIAWSDCVDDGNNDATTAQVVSLQETVSDVVCPDDRFDYYKLTISDGTQISGSITVSSQETGTEFKLSCVNSGEVFVFGTTDNTKQYLQQVTSGQLQDDTYYLRVTFYGAYPTDHQYTITIDLTEEEEEETGSTFLFRPGELYYAVRHLSPWPNARGDARNTGRANFDGPKGLATLTKSITKTKLITNAVEDRRYHSLRVGPDNSICYMDSKDDSIYKVSLSEGEQATKLESGSPSPPSFDNGGDLYFIEPGQYDYLSVISSYTSTLDSENWQQNMPAGYERGILVAGEQIYTRTEHAENSLQVWDDSGTRLHNITFPDKVLSLAEDYANDKFYVQTVDTVYKYDFSGTKEWEVKPFPDHESEYGLEPKVRLGPIVCPDGRIWVRDADTPTWVVLNSGGTKYKEYKDVGSVLPPGMGGGGPFTVAVAIDYHGRFYKVDRDSGMGLLSYLGCYDDYDNEVWYKALSGYGVTDMVLDSKNRIYICYEYYDTQTHQNSYKWEIRNSADGSVVHTQTIADIPTPLLGTHIGAELAIGENGYLVFLHQGGYLAVFKPFSLSDLDLEHKEEPSGLPGKFKIHAQKRN